MNLRRIAGALAAIVLMGGLVVGLDHAAYADNNPLPGVQFEIFPPFFNTNAPKCLDVPNGSRTRGVRLQVFHCHGFDSNGAMQLWFMENLGTDNSGPFQIRNKNSGLCLNIVLNTNGAPGTQALQNTCFGAGTGLDVESGQWVMHPTPDLGSFFALSNVRHPDECLATSNLSGNDHTSVVITNCTFTDRSTNGWMTQIWSL